MPCCSMHDWLCDSVRCHPLQGGGLLAMLFASLSCSPLRYVARLGLRFVAPHFATVLDWNCYAWLNKARLWLGLVYWPRYAWLSLSIQCFAILAVPCGAVSCASVPCHAVQSHAWLCCTLQCVTAGALPYGPQLCYSCHSITGSTLRYFAIPWLTLPVIALVYWLCLN